MLRSKNYLLNSRNQSRVFLSHLCSIFVKNLQRKSLEKYNIPWGKPSWSGKFIESKLLEDESHYFRFFEGNEPVLCSLIGKEAQTNKAYDIAQSFLAFSDDVPANVAFLKEWTSTAPGEEDWFILRFCLMYYSGILLMSLRKLCVLKAMPAKLIFNMFKRQYNTATMHFLELLFEVLMIKSVKLFHTLQAEYNPIFERDEALRKLMSRIGRLYLEIPEERQGGVLSGLLSFLS